MNEVQSGPIQCAPALFGDQRSPVGVLPLAGPSNLTLNTNRSKGRRTPGSKPAPGAGTHPCGRRRGRWSGPGRAGPRSAAGRPRESTAAVLAEPASSTAPHGECSDGCLYHHLRDRRAHCTLLGAQSISWCKMSHFKLKSRCLCSVCSAVFLGSGSTCDLTAHTTDFHTEL